MIREGVHRKGDLRGLRLKLGGLRVGLAQRGGGRQVRALSDEVGLELARVRDRLSSIERLLEELLREVRDGRE